MSIILREPNSSGTVVEFALDRVVYQSRTEHQELLIADTKSFGRTLFLDGVVQSCERDEAMYHETLVHPGMLAHGAPRRVLVGGTGEGASVREVLRHPEVARVVTCDLDDEVVRAVREHMPGLEAGALSDPRVDYRVADIADVIDDSEDGAYDVVILDITDPMEDGPAMALHSVSWYRRVARVLAEDGVLIVQSGEMDVLDMPLPRAVRSTLLEVFPWTHLLHHYVPSFHAFWTFTLAARRPKELLPDDLAERIARLAGTRVYTEVAHRKMIELPPYLVPALQQPVPPIQDPSDVPLYTGARKP